MSVISDVLGSTIGDAVKSVADAAHEFITTDKDKQQFQLQVQQLLQQRDAQAIAAAQAETKAKADIITAELQQGDNYTKRARPTIIYAGLVIIAWDYALVPTLAWACGTLAPVLTLPDFFWQAWGGVCGAYVLSRSVEKVGGLSGALRAVKGAAKQ